MMNTKAWENLLNKGLSENAYPCYAAAFGRGSEVYFRSIGGNRACFPSPLPLTEDTLFDMASLSKLMGTTMAALRLIEQGKLHLTDTVGDYFDNCHGKEDITIHHLMTHTSGIISFFHMWKMDVSPNDAPDVILAHPLAAPTGTKVIYSCMGYILLGKIMEKICGEPLDKIVTREVLQPLGLNNTMYCPGNERICVTTEKKPGSEEYICGHVHDENAHFLNGISGNAGLFSTFDDVIKFSQMLSLHGKDYISPEIFEYAITDHTKDLPSLSRGLGFQLYRDGVFPGGCQLSRGSYGHTGFTGTSIYVDKNTNCFCILLTNRVHFGRDTNKFFEYRRAFYDKVFSDLKETIL